MLEICKIKENHWMDLKKGAKLHGIHVNETEMLNLNGDCFVMIENNMLLGFGYYEIIDNTAWVKELEVFISNEQEKELYKDFLLRALINAAELKNINIMRVNKSVLSNEAMEKIGADITFEKQYVLLDIKECFNTECSCKR